MVRKAGSGPHANRCKGRFCLHLHHGHDEHGNPTGARVESLEPPSATELASASLAAVTEWRFEPAQRNGRAVAGRIAVPFVFGLNGPSAYAAPETHRQASYRTVSPGAYPDDLAGAEGVVYVRIRIEDDGSVSSSEIDRVDPPSATRLGADMARTSRIAARRRYFGCFAAQMLSTRFG